MKTITDGSAVFIVRDKRIQAMVDMFYPVGSVYISADKSKTKTDFPFMQYGTWKEVPANLCLQTGNASETGTQRSAGLPNIKGQWGLGVWVHSNFSGAGTQNDNIKVPTAYTDKETASLLSFDASKSNAIYGSSNTVQPPAYMVRAWVRTD